MSSENKESTTKTVMLSFGTLAAQMTQVKIFTRQFVQMMNK